MKRLMAIFFTFFIIVMMFGCFKKDENNSSIVIKDSGSIDIKNETADIYYEGTVPLPEKRAAGGKNSNFGYTITYSAIVKPVVVDGKNVQANDIKIEGNRAYIAYNYAGEEFRGAVQVINITDKENPVIIKEIQFNDIDINSVYIQGNVFLYGGMANPDKYENGRCIVGYINLNNIENITEEEILNGMNFYDISYAVTSIARRGDNYFIGVGAKDGGIIITDLTLARVTTGSFISLPDVRDVESYQDGVVALAGTTDNESSVGKVVTLTESGINTSTDIDDFNSPYTKATIEVWRGNVALLGLAEGGIAAMDLNDKSIYFKLANPDENILHATNSVTADGNLMFSANGEYGFRVMEVDENKLNSEFATVAGYYPYAGLVDEYGTNYSANHIVYKGGYLFVASGAGGVNIFNFEKK